MFEAVSLLACVLSADMNWVDNVRHDLVLIKVNSLCFKKKISNQIRKSLVSLVLRV